MPYTKGHLEFIYDFVHELFQGLNFEITLYLHYLIPLPSSRVKQKSYWRTDLITSFLFKNPRMALKITLRHVIAAAIAAFHCNEQKSSTSPAPSSPSDDRTDSPDMR